MTSKEVSKRIILGTNVDIYRSSIEEIDEAISLIEKNLEILEIIKKHKLLNYVLKNEKCANMYHLSKEEIDLLREMQKMERLTAHRYECDLFKGTYCKLEQLEDIEEEIGIDLITLYKALKNGFWSIDENKHIYKMKPDKGNGGAMSFYASCDCIIAEDTFDDEYIFLLKDYGKTWALTKEELEQHE